MKTHIFLSPPHMSGKELDFINKAFFQNMIAPVGENISGFENDVVTFLDNNLYAVGLNTGTSGLHLALILMGVGPGDYVICQDLTFAASANPIVYLGGKPVFVDSEKETWNISPEMLEEAIQDCVKKGKKPKAIIWVNLYGMPAKITEITGIARKYDILLLEDAAESLGSEYKGQKCGTFGDISIISFNGNKIITTSNGGMLLSHNKEFVDKARYLSTQAKEKLPYYQHFNVGYNYALSNISAGIGRGQMTVLKERIEARRANNSYYQKMLGEIPGIKIHKEPNSDYFSNHWLSCVLVDSKQTGGITREDFRLKLLELGIESRPVWKPMHLQPIFQEYPFYGNGTSEELFNNGLCLPSGSNLKPEELEEIAEIIKKMIK